MADHPTVTGSPDEIWLVYGDIERDATHAEVQFLGAVSWCGDQINDSDVRYVRADIADRLTADNENLRSVMIAAAEEIHEHWDAHCDEEGYGPSNLMRRLEEGLPAEYAYKAGDFARLQRERTGAAQETNP